MRIFKSAWFVRFARAERLSDDLMAGHVLALSEGQLSALVARGSFEEVSVDAPQVSE